jgi:hypothetical protein
VHFCTEGVDDRRLTTCQAQAVVPTPLKSVKWVHRPKRCSSIYHFNHTRSAFWGTKCYYYSNWLCSLVNFEFWCLKCGQLVYTLGFDVWNDKRLCLSLTVENVTGIVSEIVEPREAARTFLQSRLHRSSLSPFLGWPVCGGVLHPEHWTRNMDLK